MALFLLSFWGSSGQEALVLVAVQIIAFFAMNPYLAPVVMTASQLGAQRSHSTISLAAFNHQASPTGATLSPRRPTP
eukprot:scaffold31352_cov68-Phaeocystis_antarctica.AAC.2